MHLHSMTLQAIGPFPGRHHVDFAELGASGLFLLEGPTGAGKSTVIDAVVFALYGKVASEAASEDRLRSAYATPDVESFVDLVLETGSGIYRVRRSPAYERPSKRGGGTTKQQAGVRLWRLQSVPEGAPDDDAPEGDLFSSRLDEAGAELQRIIGLDRQQFVQTVVLPQGEFASFLRANPEDRRGLLQKVFGTEIYERAQAELAEMQRGAKRAVEAADAAVHQGVTMFCRSAQVGPADGETFRDAADADLPGLVAARVAEIEAEVEEHEGAELAANAGLVAARDAHDVERRLAEQLEQRAALRAEKAALDAAVPSVVEHREVLEAARRAEVVAPVRAGVEVADRAHATAQTELATVRTELPEAVAALDPTALEEARREPADAAARLRHLESDGARLPDRERDLRAGRASLADADENADVLRAQNAGRPARRAEHEAAVEESSELAAELSLRQKAVLDADAVLRAARGVEETAAALERAGDTLQVARRAAAAAGEAEDAVRAARIAGIAGELAVDLRADEKCPVCGSVEHPAPAALTADHPGAGQVEEAARVTADAQDHLAEARAEVDRLSERLEGHRAATGGTDRVAAEDRLAEARTAVTEAQHAVTVRDEARAALAEFDEETAALAERLGDVDQYRASLRSRLEAEELALERDRATIATELERAAALLGDGSPVDTVDAPNPVAVLADALDERVTAIDALRAAQAACAAAEEAVATRRTELAEVVASSGFATVDDALAAVLPETERLRVEKVVRDHDAATVRVETALEALAELADDAQADVASTQAALRDAESAYTAISQRLAFVRRRLADARADQDHLVDALGASARTRTEADPVLRMAGLASGSSGDNARAMSLATYVLVRRFEDVVAAANDRLSEMCDGRYELVRSDDKEAVRTRKTGLAMKVVDHWTEASRDPRTLSGGETFQVSLCLALGMADVVTAEAGGVDLGTLFVDEGFGTLDPESLENVLDVLGRLREGGRTIGVVSHVDAMKQSIAERIQVSRLPSGASTLTVRA
ncbi:exonuclease SbcC [Paraoerskovia marina]|uniref:Nuclease SbcCD subunit C n=1 Tax=Paraoerskovia marina TaxID=545619 RepID=A0A1H1NJ23_9CELL|nr:SMC family ATPase [Paraoerskovia marina]SDR98958.1 exonuclease SbcC [Paraoerskovia marina]